MPAQHVADSLIRDLVSEVGKGAGDAVVSPAGVLPRELNNKVFTQGQSSAAPGRTDASSRRTSGRPASGTSRESSRA